MTTQPDMNPEQLSHLGPRGRQGRSWSEEKIERDVEMAISGVSLSGCMRTFARGPVLEVGCGSGKLGIHIALMTGMPVTLVDIDPRELGYSREVLKRVRSQVPDSTPDVSHVQGDAFALDFPDYDIMILGQETLLRWQLRGRG